MTIVLVGTLLLVVLVAFVILSLLFYQRSQYKHTREVTTLTHRYEQELLKANLEIKEQTLKTVSQEIHDNIGQVLSLAKLNLNRVFLRGDDPAQTKVKNARDLVSKAIADLRNLSKTLDADYLMEQDLAASIRRELDHLGKTGTCTTTFKVVGGGRTLQPQQQLIVFRIFQEAMSNAMKHSNASAVEAILEHRADAIMLSLRDNGHGFKADEMVAGVSGMGLHNMKQRASLMGGRLDIISDPRTGTTIQLNVPLNGAAQDIVGR